MNWFQVAGLIAAKELRGLSRDLRTVVFLVLVPALLYPLLLGGAAFFTAKGQKSVKERLILVEVAPEVPAHFREAISAIKRAVIADLPGEVQARVLIAPYDDNSLIVEVDLATTLGQSADTRVRRALRRATRKERDKRLIALGASVDDLRRRKVETIDTAPPEKRTGFLLSRVLVPLLMTILMVGSFYPAADMTSGERERSTLQTLLCAPVPPSAIAAGKLITVTLVGLTAALANIVGLFATAKVGADFAGDFKIVLPWSTLPLVLVILVPFALYVSALLMAFAATTRSVQEAQTTLTPVFMVMVLPVVAASFPGTEATWKAALIPIYGPAIVLREVFAGNANAGLIVAALVGAAATIVAALGLAARSFSVDALMTGKVAAPRRIDGPLPVFDAVLLVFVMAAVYFLAGPYLARLDLLWGAGALIVLVFAGMPLLFAFVRSTHPTKMLGLVVPRRGALDLLGALMLAPTVAAGGEWIAHRLLAGDSETIEQLKRMAEQMGERPVWMLVVVFVFVPAICEEIAFRGAFLRAFSQRNAAVGIVVSSLLFALAHGSVVRMPITFAIGFIAAFVTLRVGSVVGGMAIHFAHNGLALLVASLVAKQEERVDLAGVDLTAVENTSVFLSLPIWVFALAPVGIGLLVFAWRRRPGFGDATPSDGKRTAVKPTETKSTEA